jgi:hypothetical protein
VNVKRSNSRARRGTRPAIVCVAIAMIVTAAASVASAQVKLGPPVKAAGIGTAAAKNAPNCDSKSELLAYPYLQRPPCVRPFEKGEKNGGATYPGVTAGEIKIVVVVPNHAQQETNWTQPGVVCPPNRETGKCAYLEETFEDWQEAFDYTHELWGRKVKFEYFNPSGAGEEQQRADALTVVAMKPFGVVCNGGTAGGGRIFGLAIAQAKILAFNCGGTNDDAAAQAPYVWLGGFDFNASTINGGEVLGKMFVGKPAEYSGVAADKTKTRVLGAVKPSTGLNYDLFTKSLKQYGGKNGVVKTEVTYTVPVDTSTAATQAANQSEAPTLVAKLKDEGVTTVVAFTSAQMQRFMMEAATKLNWYPEWFFPGMGAQDIEATARANDQDQMAHTFGIGSLTLYVANIQDLRKQWFDWYWGPNKASFSQGTVGTLYTLNAGLQLAGPKLTPQTFQQGLFAMPASGGAAAGQTQSFMFGYGRSSGLPYDEYSQVGLDYMLMWWNRDASGPGKILFNDGKGRFCYPDNATRYYASKWPKTAPKLFDMSNSICQYDTLPASDIPPEFPCKGCPSTKS